MYGGRITKDDCMRLLFRQPLGVLRPNGRGHWAARARAVKRVRAQARLVVLAALRQDAVRFVPRRYDVTWFFWAGAGPDVDNVLASCKALLDGCADGFGINDRVLELGLVDRVRVKRSDERAGYVALCFHGEEGEGCGMD